MRGYLGVTTVELTELLEKSSFNFSSAFVLDTEFARINPDLDEEELEFLLSWMAAQASRKEGGPNSWGFVLAVDLESWQVGGKVGEDSVLLSEIMWSQVESILVAESDEPELTWYGAQELAIFLPAWKA